MPNDEILNLDDLDVVESATGPATVPPSVSSISPTSPVAPVNPTTNPDDLVWEDDGTNPAAVNNVNQGPVPVTQATAPPNPFKQQQPDQADPMWPGKNPEVKSFGDRGQKNPYPELPAYTQGEKAHMADARGDKISADQKDDEKISEVAGKKYAAEFAKTERGIAFNNAHMEALKENFLRDFDEALAINASIDKAAKATRLRQKFLQDWDEALRMNAERDRRIADQLRRQAMIANRWRRTVLIATTALIVGLGGTWVATNGKKALQNLPDVTSLVRRGGENGEGDSKPNHESLNQALGVPDGYEVEEYETEPDWYIWPEFINGSSEGQSQYIVHTLYGDITAEPIVEYTEDEEYHKFTLPNNMGTFALKMKYGLDPNSPNEGETTIVGIVPKQNN